MLTCTRCSRVNPDAALFCYNDGAALGDPSRRHGKVDPARQRFPMPFVFPSGKACHTFDEMVLAILDHWEAAGDLLRHGVFTNFLAGLGRADLSVAAREAAAFPDLDRGLDQLLQSLPSQVLQPAKLAVEPGQINLGTVRAGQDGRVDLRLSNQGMGLLHGTINCAACPWLSLGDPAAGTRKKLFQLLHESTLRVNVCGKSLRAGNKPQDGKIIIESSGGTFAVVVTVDVPVQKFSEGVLAGATTPRQIAEKAKQHPKEAAGLFARGAVAKWYESNGWTYPVTEPSASGLAAVQQFFEALGLTTPPKVGINVMDVRLEGRSGDIVRSTVQVISQEKRPVYAHAVSDQPWLLVNDVALEGRTATVNLRVPEVPHRPGEILHAKVTITANGRQRFVVPVSLTVTGGGAGAGRFRASPPVDTMLPPLPPPQATNGRRRGDPAMLEEVLPVVDRLPEAPRPSMRERPRYDDRYDRDRDFDFDSRRDEDRGGGRKWLASLPVIFLMLGLLVTLGRDLYAWMAGPAGGPGGGPPDNFGPMEQLLSIQYHENEEQVRLSRTGGTKPPPGVAPGATRPGFWEPSMRFGLTMRKPDQFGQQKRLTFEMKGLTNNACVRLDGSEYLFGERPFRLGDGTYATNIPWPGRWHERNAKLDRPLRDGRKSIWVYDAQQIYITQTVGLVPGEQSGKLDTCLVHYKIENKSEQAHTVGLRFMLDTFIGGNDGVPFLIPGSRELCSTMMEFTRPEDVPDFIQARETENLENPGTIAQIQLKVPGMEPPSRVTLGAWPNPVLGMGARQEKTLWNVPVLPIKSMVMRGGQADSAVVIYWNEKSIAPGASREVAFAYGLGNVAGSEGGGRLALTVGGAFVPNGEFTLTAYVNNPVHGQTVTVSLPEGFSLVSEAETQTVPALGFDAVSRTSPVTWKIRAGPREGKYTLKVTSSTGVSQTQPVQIKVRGIFGS
jgi:hypothetical protein